MQHHSDRHWMFVVLVVGAALLPRFSVEGGSTRLDVRRRVPLPVNAAGKTGVTEGALVPNPLRMHPYVRRRIPVPVKADGVTRVKESDFQPGRIDFSSVRVLRSLNNPPDPADPNFLKPYNLLWDARAAAVVRSSGAGELFDFKFYEMNHYDFQLEESILIPRHKLLSLMAFRDYFPATYGPRLDYMKGMASEIILQAKPGWAGTFGPDTDGWMDLLFDDNEGNYDMALMHLVPLAYRYYGVLTEEAREHLIRRLLAGGRVHRLGRPDVFTSGVTPDDWNRAGWTAPLLPGVAHTDIGETENHILMILTARYLTNQLLYQRTGDYLYDNRMNGDDERPHTADLVLSLLRDILRDDFSEYNAKPYQKETRLALLNLASYAYDSEVRLAARMVLDYVSARIAVSSNDLRRMVPFRRQNKGKYISRLPNGVMNVGLLDWNFGADPLVAFFMLQTGNTRALESGSPFPGMLNDEGDEIAVEVVSDYRLPPSIHDLFVNDLHRRFFQRLHRTKRPDESANSRNCDHFEINASSPSYLITAGGKPCTYAIDPYFGGIAIGSGGLFGTRAVQQRGIAVPTSFMPTGSSAGVPVHDASGLIQFSRFSELIQISRGSDLVFEGAGVANYGVAPDLAFGYGIWLPQWVRDGASPPVNGFIFVDKKPRFEPTKNPGFCLAIYRNGDFGLLEALDTWLHQDVSCEQFKAAVLANNRDFWIRNNTEALYTTYNGNRVRFVIWNDVDRDECISGAKVLHIDYGPGDPSDSIGDAANVTNRFLNGTILDSPAEAVVVISNPFLGTTIRLDLSDKWNPVRTSETGEVETRRHEVWVDFDHEGEEEGNFYRPFRTLEAAVAAVADGGVIKIVPGTMRQKQTIRTRKHIKLVTPVPFTIGAR